jgi:hypothetical protein
MEPEFKLIRELPKALNTGAIERAVEKFVVACDMDVDPAGFYNQTLQRIAGATSFQQPGAEFWLAHAYGEVAGYALASVSVDIDARLTYWVAQSWVDPVWRGHAVVKQSWQAIRKRARELMCAHLMIVSCRNPKAECRWLGEGMQIYATLLKQDLGAAKKEEVEYGRRSENNCVTDH